ncbi:hypothetical protein [Prevotella sp. HCN-7019]|uniref:hypothetical protein n=1 Tax=Prevotella sp. HCN-7019 TaxID=3134668 RepID=UPI00260E91E5
MTTTVQHHIATSNNEQKCRTRRSYLFSQNIYQVEVNGEEGECLTYEIMADSCAEATATAESLASDSMVNISYISVMPMD